MANSELLEKAVLEIEEKLQQYDKILIGAGAGLSAAAGLSYMDHDAFKKYYPDMYRLGYHFPYELVGRSDSEWSRGRKWAYWSTHIHYVRRIFPQSPLYSALLSILQNKDYFVVTSNTDRQFMRAGFPMEKVFEYQGNYDNMGCSVHCCKHTWDNYSALENARKHINHDTFECSEEGIPKCPYCGADAEICFRGEDYETHWKRYINFLDSCEQHSLLLIELGVGFNTPGVIRWPFEKITYQLPRAHLIRINKGYDEPGYTKARLEHSKYIESKLSSYDLDAADVIFSLQERVAYR